MELKLDFKDTKVELPKKSGNYLCVTSKGYKNISCPRFIVLEYSKKHQKFNVRDEADDLSLAISACYWAKISNEKDCPWMYEEGKNETD